MEDPNWMVLYHRHLRKRGMKVVDTPAEADVCLFVVDAATPCISTISFMTGLALGHGKEAVLIGDLVSDIPGVACHSTWVDYMRTKPWEGGRS